MEPIEQTPSETIDLAPVVSDKEIQFYIDNGYLVVEGLMTGEELDEIKADTIKITRGGYETESIKPVDDSISDEDTLKNILCIHQPHHVSPVMEKFAKHEKICGILSQITAAHLPHWDGSVKCMQSMLFIKPPEFQGQAWHQDEIYIGTRDRSLVGAWIAIDDATIENGCLMVLPGSHKSGYLYPQRDHENPDEFDFAPESYGFDESEEIPVEVKAGALVFFNGYLLHRSRKNLSNDYRKVLVNHYCNAWSLIPANPKEGESPATADRRSVLHVAGTDPYAWKGYDVSNKDVYLRHCKAIDKKTTD
ncbi:MAG: phytanoyl-CoA dioxygenase family protein [Lentisphaeria bacterium]|nr:phytanoyl-CoA dioxygenase family protein [Lentisphaeria bacterium]NQZ66664.1 phytanoyl-CoA dioxygenase family protein [Lentisphaeria bacterium]